MKIKDVYVKYCVVNCFRNLVTIFTHLRLCVDQRVRHLKAEKNKDSWGFKISQIVAEDLFPLDIVYLA